jgi:hypothetical protein
VNLPSEVLASRTELYDLRCVKCDARIPPHGHRGVAPCPPQGGCTTVGGLRCCDDIAHQYELGILSPSVRGVGS